MKRSSSKSFRPVDCCALAAAVDVAEAEAVAVVKALALAVTVVLDVGSIGSFDSCVFLSRCHSRALLPVCSLLFLQTQQQREL